MKEAQNYLKVIQREQIEKLIAAGFTEKQAEVLLEVMEVKVLSGGFF